MVRIEQANEAIKRALNEIFLRELEHTPGIFVTITRVETRNDRQRAEVFFSVFPFKSAPSILKQLKRKKDFFRILLGRRILSRYVPDLSFFLKEGSGQEEEIDVIWY